MQTYRFTIQFRQTAALHFREQLTHHFHQSFDQTSSACCRLRGRGRVQHALNLREQSQVCRQPHKPLHQLKRERLLMQRRVRLCEGVE
jgi:hypothetical protein